MTNPDFGRGMCLRIAHAFALADASAETCDDLEHLALAAMN